MRPRRELLLLGGFFAITCGIALWIWTIPLSWLKGPNGYVLEDTDSYVRWHFVKRALAGDGVRIRWVTMDNAPFGRLNEWTSPMTIIGVTAVRLTQLIGRLHQDRALELCGVWLGPSIGVCCIGAIGWLGWKAGGWPLAACWMFAWPLLKLRQRTTQVGNTDHHGLHELLFFCMVGGCIAWRHKPTVAGGVFVGFAGSIAIWSGGTELLPAWFAVTALAVYDAFQPRQEKSQFLFWRAWWITGLAATLAAWLFEFWPNPFHGRLEFLSVWHVILWIIVGVLLQFLHRSPAARDQKLLAVVGAAGLAIVAAGATRGFDWAHVHVFFDKRFQWQMGITSEYAPFAASIWEGIRTSWWEFGLLPLALCAITSRTSRNDRVICWAVITTLGFSLLMVLQVRWEGFCAAALVMSAGLLLRAQLPRHAWLCVVVVLIATIPPWIQAAALQRYARQIQNDPLSGPKATTFKLEAASRCLGDLAPHSIVLLPWQHGAILGGMGEVRVIGTGFWSNTEGLMATYELYSTASEERFWELVRSRQIEFLVVNSKEQLELDIAVAYVTLEGREPTLERIHEAAIWRLVRQNRLAAVRCERLQQMAPDWKILRLDPVDFSETR